MRRPITAITLLAVMILAHAEPSYGAGPTPILLNNRITIELDGNATSAVAHLLVSNDGDSGDVVIQLIDTATGRPLPLQDGQEVLRESHTVSLGGHKVTPVELRVVTGRSTVEGNIVIQPSAARAAVGSFATARKPATSWLWYPVAGSVLALVIVVGAWLAPGSSQALLGKPLAVTADWRFNESWASNTTALAAVTGTVLGLSGFLNDALRGVVVTRFIGLNALLLALLAAAPLVFSAFAKKVGERRVGTVGGFLLASWITLSATFGELIVLALMLYMARGGIGAWLLGGLLSAAAAILVVYAWRSIGDTITNDRSHTGSGSTARRMLREEAVANPYEARLSLI